ncbi:MAG: competence/damage-inducible protein A [Planctomycetes bacterium]|nr:competence/damage-inducible protein A [Planctomycetota bacterium]
MKRACIVSIGNELLNGRTVDTNAHWLSGQLLTFGIPTCGVWVVGDEMDRIVSSLTEAAKVGDFIFITGGLGPTDDDLTRQAMADFLGVELEFRQELLDIIEAFFTSRKIVTPSINRMQAMIPKGANVIDNPIGTAPGIYAVAAGKEYFCLPGVPVEMRRMFDDMIRPRLKNRQGGPVSLTERVSCYGAGESIIAQQLGDMMKRGRNPLVNCTVNGGDITLHIVAEAADFETARQMIAERKRQIVGILGSIVYSTEDKTLPEVVGQLLRQKKMTLATAESCTGGLVGKLITDVPGSSGYYRGGWVTYSNELKNRELGVPEERLKKYGAVSEQVAGAMAQGAVRRTGADAAIAITGIAGPDGGTEQKPVGLVYIAVQIGKNLEVREFRFAPLSREMIRQRAALSALNLLRLKLGV